MSTVLLSLRVLWYEAAMQHKCTYYATDQTFVGTAHLTVAKKVFFPFCLKKKKAD